MNLFAYGTLMFPEVWRAVVGREIAGQPASIDGFSIFRAQGHVFPVLIRGNADDRVAGLAYAGLTAGEFARLDAYESEIYDRVEVDATLDEGGTIRCQCYVLPDERRELASSERWDRDWFECEALAGYLRRLRD